MPLDPSELRAVKDLDVLGSLLAESGGRSPWQDPLPADTPSDLAERGVRSPRQDLLPAATPSDLAVVWVAAAAVHFALFFSAAE